ncbi:MAG: SDR family oxidoreductase, partial [Alphaproteobacteria bacterium]
CIAPVAKTRMSANVPMEIQGIGEAEDIAPMVVYLLSDKARSITGQVYTVSGGKIAVWNQPVEVRAMFKDGRWTPEEIEQRLPSTVGVERMGLIDRLEAMRKAAASGEKPNT